MLGGNVRTTLIFSLCIVLVGCKKAEQASVEERGTSKPLVVFSQANSQDPWRQVFDAEMKAAASEHASEFAFEMQEAQDNANTQISQVEAFLLKSPKALLISPATVALKDVCERAFDKGIPVILLDRSIPGDKYTCFISGDNVEIGRQAAKFIVERLKGKGTVLEIYGLAGSTATDERHKGADEVFKATPGIKVIEGDHCDYQRNKAQSFMQTFLQRGDNYDAVLAHNDEMAIGAWQAMSSAGVSGKIIVGIDGCQKEVVEMIRLGKLTATFTYPHPARKGIEVAAGLLKGITPEKVISLPTERVDSSNADDFLKSHPNLAK
jgi:ribose transport system substrate-binding protein